MTVFRFYYRLQSSQYKRVSLIICRTACLLDSNISTLSKSREVSRSLLRQQLNEYKNSVIDIGTWKNLHNLHVNHDQGSLSSQFGIIHYGNRCH
jgi:hypothetical protein